MKHLRENNEAYFSHLKFAGGMGLSLILRGVIFLVHGLIPIISVPKIFNLEATVKKMSEWEEYTRKRMKS
jgi:hypothetical protein